MYLILSSGTSQDARWNDDVNVMSVAGQSSQVVFFVSCLLSSPIFNHLRNHVNRCDRDRAGIGKNAKVNEARKIQYQQ